MKESAQKRDLGEGKAALLVIDVQQGLFGKSTPIYRAETLLANIDLLTRRAHEAGVLVVYIQHDDRQALVKDSPQWQLHPQLRPLAGDPLVAKQHPNAFEGTNLGGLLQAQGVTCLSVCGLVTHGCVRATCVGALELGYAVTLAADAHSSYNPQAADLVEKWNAKLTSLGARVIPTAEIDFAG